MNRTRALLVGVALVACGTQAAAADAATVYTEAKRLGDGFAQVYVELDGEGAPRVLGVSFDQGMLEGLPAMSNTWSRCFDKDGDGRIADHVADTPVCEGIVSTRAGGGTATATAKNPFAIKRKPLIL